MKQLLIGSLAISAVAGCAPRADRPTPEPVKSANRVATPAAGDFIDLLDEQADAWNRGDLEGFMDYYWRSDALTFVSGEKVIHGWQATLDRYKERYPTPLDMGRLDFEDLVVKVSNSRSASVTGRYRVRTRGAESTGSFVLSLRKVGSRWLIVHDHTTADTPQ